MASTRVLLLENIHPAAELDFNEAGHQVSRLDQSYSGATLLEKAAGFEVLGIRSKTTIGRTELQAMSQVLSIGCFCIGTDQVDLKAAKQMGIPVFNAPYSNTRSVAELVIAEIVALSRKLGDVNMHAHRGGWIKSAKGSFEVRGKTLGIVGYGHIGSQVSILAEAFGMNVVFFDVEKKLPLGNSRSVSTLNELLKLSDFLTLHVPDTADTRQMIGAAQLKLMRKGAFLLNLSRGTVVNLNDLADSLRAHHIAGAAVDVFPKEPESNKDRFECPLQEIENVILTPHIGGSTEEAQQAIGMEVSASLISFLKTGATAGAVNFPQVSLPRLTQSYRVANVHKNVPGVLGEINSIVSRHGVNIAAQYLATDSDIGYLVMDVEADEVHSLVAEIQSLKTSVKTRVI